MASELNSAKILFNELSGIENILLASFEKFRQTNGDSSMKAFVDVLVVSNMRYLYDSYPVAENILLNYKKKEDVIDLVHQKFSEDKQQIKNSFFDYGFVPNITNVNAGAGDYHKGLSTAILHLDHEKIVFKPTSAGVSKSFFFLLNWIEKYYDLGDCSYKIIDKDSYHWLSFVNPTDHETKDEISLYYERAGFMLGILYITNASDFHYENVIAKKNTPVLIDHETIVQPKINKNFLKFFKSFLNKEIEDSVVSTMLLPNHKEETMPVGTCGYGYHKQKSRQVLKKEFIDRYNDNWRSVTRFAEESFKKENIPTLKGVSVYPISHLKELLSGFEKSYNLFKDKKSFLVSGKTSPILTFENKTIRFIWRATNVYAKILKQMELPKNLKSIKNYEQKIKDYLFVAFKNVPEDSELMKIYHHEVAHMLKGDIPFFEVNTSSKDLITDFGVIKNFFELNCLDNFKRKINKLSNQDLKYQKQIIINSYQKDAV